MNKKGFMMAELVVVSAIVLVTLTGLYVSYAKIYTLYSTRLTYYDVNTLYSLGSKVNSISSADVSSVTSTSFTKVNDIYVTKISDSGKITATIPDVHNKFKDYITYLEGNYERGTDSYNYIFVMEKCNDKDDCKYAYLEAYYEET